MIIEESVRDDDDRHLSPAEPDTVSEQGKRVAKPFRHPAGAALLETTPQETSLPGQRVMRFGGNYQALRAFKIAVDCAGANAGRNKGATRPV
jgi:hypothetical protein